MTFSGVLLMVLLIVFPTGEAKSDSKDKEGLPFYILLMPVRRVRGRTRINRILRRRSLLRITLFLWNHSGKSEKFRHLKILFRITSHKLLLNK